MCNLRLLKHFEIVGPTHAAQCTCAQCDKKTAMDGCGVRGFVAGNGGGDVNARARQRGVVGKRRLV